jgi:penicillin-binding protein 1A
VYEDTRAPAQIANPRRGGLLGVFARALVFGVIATAALGGAVGAGFYVWFARDLPDILPFEAHTFEGQSTFYADDGQVVGEFFEERRIPLPYAKIPRTLVLAFLATEDARFFSHSGVDLRGIARAALRNLEAGAVVEGGSTITQQLAKAELGSRRTFERKIREAIFARRLEDVYTKEQILLLYLNRTFLGHASHGIQAAAQNYFRKNVWNLTLGEMAMLAGLPAAPSRLNPYYDMDAALERRANVLRRMVEAGFIDHASAEAAREEPLRVFPLLDDHRDKVPTFVDEVRRELPEIAGANWRERGLDVFTTADVQRSMAAQSALQEGLHAADQRQGYRGPLAKGVRGQARDELLRRARAWLRGQAPQVGETLVGVALEVSADTARIALTPDLHGTIHLEDSRWAGPYTELPEVGGRRDESGEVSFKPKLDGLWTAIEEGDAVLVRVIDPEPVRAREQERQAKVRRKAARAQGQPAAALDEVPLEDFGLALALDQLPKVEGAFAAMDVDTGAVVAMVGSYDYDRSEFNRVTALRQTGSAMKPIVYGKGYDIGMPPSMLFSGAPFDTGSYNPTGDRASEDMIAWNALTRSENSISLRVLQYVLAEAGLEDYKAWGRALGLERDLEGYPSEVLGADQTLRSMLSAYGTFASRGRPPARRMIRRVVDDSGQVLARSLDLADPGNTAQDMLDAAYDALAPGPPTRIREEVAWLISANLREVTRRGTAAKSAKELDFPVAGKTGTLPYDVWFIGWSERLIAGAWVGSDKRERPLGKSRSKNLVYGADTALPIWTRWMKGAHGPDLPGNFLDPQPAHIEIATIDPKSGNLAASDGIRVPHLEGTAPTRAADTGAAQDRAAQGAEFEF